MKPFVRDEVILPKLPCFINSSTPLTEEKLESLKDSIERDLIFGKTLELLSEKDPAISEKIISLKKAHRGLSNEELLSQALSSLTGVK